MGRARASAHVAVAVVLTGAIAPRPCGADAADSTAVAAAPAFTEARINFDAFLSSTYSYNFNRPASGTNQFRVFDFDDNTFKVDVVELVAQRPVVKPRDSGFRLDLTVGSSIPRVTAAAGLFRD